LLPVCLLDQAGLAGDSSAASHGGDFGTYRADKQVVERGPLFGAQGAEQVVLDLAELGVGESELVLARR
jgi:hypothetical protein